MKAILPACCQKPWHGKPCGSKSFRHWLSRLAVALGPIESGDPEEGSWRAGYFLLGDEKIACGGGSIASEETASNYNSERGINCPVWCPGQKSAGDYIPWQLGEEESGWEGKVMPLIWGDDWEGLEDAREYRALTYQVIQSALEKQHE